MEGAEVHADWLAEGAPVPVDPRVSEPLSRAATIPTPFYIRAMRRRVELARAMNGRFEAVDILALPASPVLAPTISALKADDALCDRVEGLMLRNTQVANQFDLCAISLPVPGTALPVGLMLVARHGHDRHLFDIAAGVEALLTGWEGAKPFGKAAAFRERGLSEPRRACGRLSFTCARARCRATAPGCISCR